MPQFLFDTLFSLLGAQVTWFKIIALAFALGNLICNAYEIHWAWPLTIISGSLHSWEFYNSEAYGDAAINFFFVIAAFWAWWQWLYGRRIGSQEPLRITNLDKHGWLLLTITWLVGWLFCALLYANNTSNDIPWFDGFVTAATLVGAFLLARKFIENWLIWIVMNGISVILYWHKALYLTATLYSIFCLLAIWGWLCWRFKLPDKAD